jgi:hypothetical protein
VPPPVTYTSNLNIVSYRKGQLEMSRACKLVHTQAKQLRTHTHTQITTEITNHCFFFPNPKPLDACVCVCERERERVCVCVCGCSRPPPRGAAMSTSVRMTMSSLLPTGRWTFAINQDWRACRSVLSGRKVSCLLTTATLRP